MIDRYQTPEMARLWSEAEKYRRWLEVEVAAVAAWEELGEVPAGTTDEIRRALEGRPLDEAFAERVADIEAETRHDIVAFTRALTERVGPPARFVHLGLTSTDVVDTAQNLVLRDALTLVEEDAAALSAVLAEKAVRYRDTPCVGRTHGVHAEPMTFGLKFLKFLAMVERDRERLGAAKRRISVAMLSGSVGTYAHVPPDVEAMVAATLGLEVDPVTDQTVARDRHADVLAALALAGTTIERIATEIRHLQRTEVREVMEGFAKGQTGSSSMPHKKNPIATENLTGVARILRGNLQAALENVTLWHERDISHSSVERVILPDSTTLASYALRRLRRVVEDLAVFPERMQANLDALHGLVYSQRVLHALIDRGMMREAAYDVVQRNSLRSWEEGLSLKDLLLADAASPLTEDELDQLFDPAWYLRHVDTIYARFGL